ncbi:LacI family DNA-binding transcriptional regulator [Paenibacillus roseipurpureus]|uniref:LacI family DNA-binding transcriptional regulator n=1 Tax=Paenibacillus roseopurpureus TaxID=2918901 RepID=A0AA96RM13_9BACL|nr:LacI family DNA-binding transcriptional regulator [Paenibacillus sp. MBLB1832]WNR43732.1 LacI family DNA-binding transcriptional regulator [Paenibacillus sp. MBLB1832]
MRKRVTLHDLADGLGLTIQTVSKALRGLPGMSEQTRSEVFRLARELGYMTKDQKQTLQLDHISPYPVVQRRFVLIQNKQSLNFNRLLLQGLHERFMEFGHTVQPILIPPQLKPSQFEDWAEEQGLPYAEGVFIAPRMNLDLLEQKLLELPLPRILLNFPRQSPRWIVSSGMCMRRCFKRCAGSCGWGTATFFMLGMRWINAVLLFDGRRLRKR